MSYSTTTIAQSNITYIHDIAPLIKTHCLSCHQRDGIGPFNLDSYSEVSKRAKFIAHVSETGYMPPWRANTAFQHYKNENILNAEEKAMIVQWVKAGAPEGKKSNKDKIGQYQDPHAKILTSIPNVKLSSQYILYMQKPFSMPVMGKEEFRFFHIPFQNNSPRYIQAVGFKPGNTTLVHHARVMCDTSGNTAGINGLSADDESIYQYQTSPLSDPFLFGWVPGNHEIRFPEGTGKLIYPNTDLVLNIHYAPTPIPATDLSGVTIEWATKKVEREVITLTMTENEISNPPFYIKANTQPTFYMRSAMLESDVSFISIMPHMHFLGKSFKAFAVTPEGDLIPLVDVPRWDFNWQMTYTFQKYLKIPKGSVIYAEAQYDNTEQNPLNPYNPLRDVGFGWGTKDEMMNLVIYYVKYKNGDENISL